MTFCGLILFTKAFSQYPNNSIILSNAKIQKCTISSHEYSKGKQIDSSKNVETYDQFGHTIKFETLNNAGVVTNTIDHSFTDRNTEIAFEYGKGGKLAFKNIHVYNNNGAVIRHFQLTPRNDTLVSQTWIKNRFGLDSIIVTNNKIQSHKEYDVSGNVVYEESFDENGKLTKRQYYKEKKDGNCTMYYSSLDGKKFVNDGKICKIPGQEIAFIDDDSEGYLYGIKLTSQKGGKIITNTNARGLVTSISYIDAHNKPLALIDFQYESF